MLVSIIVPVYNEEENISETVRQIGDSIGGKFDFELLLIDDGSTDKTRAVGESLASNDPRVKIVSYSPNQGRGKALRTGFEMASGDIVISIDADLSYSPDHILRLYETFQLNPLADIVVGSPYMKGGMVNNVPFKRLLWSKYGNRFLSYLMPGKLTTFTGILRGYRKAAIKSLQLESDDKEIHLEILSKALALNYRIIEIPAALSSRKRGKSKFRLKSTVLSHIAFSLFEKPAVYMGVVGTGFIFLGMLGGAYVVYLWQRSSLNPERPLMTLLVLLVLSGIQILAFSIIATQLVYLRNEIYRIQKENLEIKSVLENRDR